MGIEADVILFNPYLQPMWGFDKMDPATDDRFTSATSSRDSSRPTETSGGPWPTNSTTSKPKPCPTGTRYFQIVQKSDPYDHL